MKIFQKIYDSLSADGRILTAYDKNGEEIYQNNYGMETWFVRKNGLLIKVINSDGLVVNREHNAEGNPLLVKDNKGFERQWEYNPEGKPIHAKDTKGYEEWWEYDQNEHLKSYKNSNGKEKHYEHTPEGNLVSLSLLMDGETFETYRYDNWGNEVYCKYHTIGKEEWWTYGQKGKKTSYKNSNGEQWLYKYDEKGRLVITEKNDGSKENRKYDKAGRIIQIITSSGSETIYKYDDRGNKIYKKSHVLPEFADYWEENLLPPGDPWEMWWEYNDQNLLIHSKNNDGKEEWFTYDAYGNETNKKWLENGKVQWTAKTQYLYYEQLTEYTEWLFPFEQK
ncbi:hypothetical protein OOZ15_08870 [Galbibacter sp. EGI 63066]|uniref:RHS repeat domain-containing protein n=1 Tax=Galbibacter sp. EGI 63066 TaxID=2993559 RepID=UPI002249A1D2|nr:RHS repeat domain-containing protein [Galbibacter sp. EGI 63066]MCX2680047.1 hypothetical protein [Galbibacter sp. EGI 63066]